MSIADLKIRGEDKLKRAFVLPKKILWTGDGVENVEHLLVSEITQVYLGMPEVTKLSNKGGRKGAVLLDFGSEFVGSLELIVGMGMSNPKGVKLHIRFGESVSEAMSPIGEKNATNDHAVRDMTVHLTALSQQTFAYTGCRFVYLELEEEDATIELATVRGIVTYRDIPYKGTFMCDDEVLNKIYHVCAYTVHMNMQNMLWDGIKRDRLVWIGDTHPEMLAIRSVFGDNDIIDDCLEFIAKTNPLPQWPNHFTTYGFWYLLILWDWYWYNGRVEKIVKLKDYWSGLISQLLELVHEEHEELLNQEEFAQGFFVDWATYGTEEAKAGVYALFRLTLLAAAKLCGLAGEEEQKNQCLRYAELLAKKNVLHNGKKQIVALLKLAGMIEDSEAGRILINGGGHGMSTFMSYYILSAVVDTASMNDAQEMLREYYGAMLDAGATTFWEDFDLDWVRTGARIDTLLEPGEYDIHGDNGKFCYIGMRHSLCHGWSAGPAAFLPERVLGIQILDAGCKRVSVKPDLGELEWAKGTYPTPYGEIRVSVKREGNRIICNVEAPEEIEIVR